jgi:hypothetical protein
MPSCPQCNKPLAALVRTCPSCRADLDLLVEYVDGLKIGLNQAEKLTRAGELGQAVWAYLSVLEVDPDNAVARRQVADVTMAVRHFGTATAPRRGLGRIWNGAGKAAGWLWIGLVSLLVLIAFGLGYTLASRLSDDDQPHHDGPPKVDKPNNTLGG